MARQDLLGSTRVAVSYAASERSLLWDILRFSGGEDNEAEETPIVVPRTVSRFEASSRAEEEGGKLAVQQQQQQQQQQRRLDSADRIIMGAGAGGSDDIMAALMPPGTPSASRPPLSGASPVSVLDSTDSPMREPGSAARQLQFGARGDVEIPRSGAETYASSGTSGGDVEVFRGYTANDLTRGTGPTARNADAAACRNERDADSSSAGRRPFFIKLLERSVAVATAVTIVAVGRMIPEHIERDFGTGSAATKGGALASCIMREQRAPFYLAGPDVLAGRG